MKRLLYITTVPFDFESLDGVQKKILNQLNCFSKKYDVKLLCRTSDAVMLISIPKMEKLDIKTDISRKGILQIATEWLNKELYDLLYIRYPKSDPLLIKLLKHSKENKIKSIIEIPTYPYDKEGLETVFGIIKALIDKMYRRKLKTYLDRIVTYSNDKIIFGVKTLNTINGINFENINLLNTTESSDIHLIAVSSMYRVHGYERIIQGIGDYYSTSHPERNVYLDLVGDGDYIQIYKELVKKNNIEDYVFFHGKKFGSDLEELYKNANIGINSLAIHRQGLKNESTLKAKEYAAYGLPIVSSSYVDAFSQNDNSKYVFRVKPDDTVVSVNDIINFYNKLHKDTNFFELKKEIRNAAMKVCDMQETLKVVMDFYDN